MVVSDNCKISKALPSAMGLRVRQLDTAACSRGFKGRKKLLSGKEEEDTDMNDKNDNQKHKVGSSVEARKAI